MVKHIRYCIRMKKGEGASSPWSDPKKISFTVVEFEEEDIEVNFGGTSHRQDHSLGLGGGHGLG